jgi:phosphatidylserine/phosphatidylglycerophosphate/cardiolipin synthase-like enzyme
MRWCLPLLTLIGVSLTLPVGAYCAAPLPATTESLHSDIEVLETAPLGSRLDLPDLRNALDVLPGLFARAESTIEISQMYMLYYRPESQGRILFLLYDALIAAAQRGVRVRILLDSTTLEANSGPTYQKMRDSLARVGGIEVRACDPRPYSEYPECMLHAKYIVVDRRLTVIGSHNWSFSAFADNRELSLLVRDTTIARQLQGVFETDWNTRAGLAQVSGPRSQVLRSETPNLELPTRSSRSGVVLVVTSPAKLRDSTLLSTTDALRRVFGKARSSLDLEVNSLTTRADFGDAKQFTLLDSLLRAAADRGVRIRLLVDCWAYDCEPDLFRRLNQVDRIRVRVIDISELGPNPKTGTVHAKMVVADRAIILIGSATFSQRQLLECRNVGLLVERRDIAAQLEMVFDTDWNSKSCFRP